MADLTWGAIGAPLHLAFPDDAPVSVSLATPVIASHAPALVEILQLGQGRALTNTRMNRSVIGDRLRYTEHHLTDLPGGRALDIVQADAASGLQVTVHLEHYTGVDAYRCWTRILNGGEGSVTLHAVTSVVLGGLSAFLGDASQLELWTAENEWCAESRWSSRPLEGPGGLVDINAEAHGHTARGTISRTSASTWSSGAFVPAAVLHGGAGGALMWQIEHNGPWRWELNTLVDRENWLSLAMLGPTDLDHAWSTVLPPGEDFTTVPVSFALGDGFHATIRAMTEHRRRSHRPVGADAGRPLVVNDYMNALMGDPTEEKLLPLIDAAAEVGAEYFCIDAGWYDDGHHWWPSVGEWKPSTRRFGSRGLQGVLEYITERGMKPGLWVEPEVVGVRSPVASALGDECFMRRDEIRIVEHERYFLDLRSPMARDYLDSVFDRLITEYGARYFKWDYNVTPGSGPNDGAASPGEGLLAHSRAHLEWFDRLRDRYPEVIFEACSSGAQRMDPAILSRYDLQSTSDQQDYRKYPPIAASAPMAMAPEQAGNWAYPQAGWSLEQVAFTLVTGLSGRLYLSGNLDRLDTRALELVREATSLYPQIMAQHATGFPHWPLGLPAWRDNVIAVANSTSDATLVYLWNRTETGEQVVLSLPRWRHAAIDVQTLFPSALPPWPATWDPDAGQLRLDLHGQGEGARVLRLTSR